MTIEEAKQILETAKSPALKRDLKKFIYREEKLQKYGGRRKRPTE
nr:MAG TPA: Calcyclin-binding protein [Caudoviricetes sp.]